MILGSFVLFFLACVLVPVFLPAAFLVWLVSAVMFFAGLSSRGTRKAMTRATAASERRSAPVSRTEGRRRECPSCKELMRVDAEVCPHCRRESRPWILHEGVWWTTNDDGKQFWLDEKSMKWVPREG